MPIFGRSSNAITKHGKKKKKITTQHNRKKCFLDIFKNYLK